MAVVASSFAVLTIAPSLWLLYGLVLLLETFGTVARPAFMAALKDAVPAEQRAAVNGAFFAAMTIAQLVGPLLGALVLAPLGAAAVFAANGLTFLAVAAAVTRLRGGVREEGEAPPAAPAPEQTAPPGKVGYGWLLRRPDLGLYAVVSLSLALLAQAAIALFVVRANAFGLGDGGVGVFYAAVAVGSLAGSVAAGTGFAGDRTALFRVAVSAVACGLALAAFGVAGNVALAVAALAVAGFTTDFHEVTAITYFQDRLPDEVFGRFFSLFLMALSAGGLVGALVGPFLERSVGVAAALAVLAAPGVGVALVLAGAVRRWDRTLGPTA
jgi:MFS family permease